jgi:hypothetical protein
MQGNVSGRFLTGDIAASKLGSSNNGVILNFQAMVLFVPLP